MDRHRNREFDWDALVSDYLPRMASLASAVVLWYFSVVFSADAFGFVAGSKYTWMGGLLAVCGVTVPEILFNNGHYRKNLTITLLSVCAYIYGIGSNIIGLWVAMGAPEPDTRSVRFWMVVAASVPAGLLLEIAPEPLLNIGLGIGNNGYDFVNQVAELLVGKPKIGGGFPRPPQPFRAEHSPSGERVRCKSCGSSEVKRSADGYTCLKCGCHKIANAAERMPTQPKPKSDEDDE